MFKRSSFFTIAICFTLLLSGCGGGGDNNSNNSIVLSSDYAGYEVGYKHIYKINYTDSESGTSKSGSYNIISYTLSNNSGILKEAQYQDGEYLAGIYIKKDGSKYYETGEWTTDTTNSDIYPEYIYNKPIYLLENPLSINAETWWGKVIRQEAITVSGKSYTAWYIEYEYSTSSGNISYYDLEKIWFVPNIGIVHADYVEKENGVITYQDSGELISAKFETPATSSVSTQLKALKSTAPSQGSRKKNHHLFGSVKF